MGKAHYNLRHTTQGDISKLRKRDGDNCHWCKFHVGEDEASREHVIPLSEGGTHSLENLALAHTLCNHIQNWARHANVDITGRERELYLLAKNDRKEALEAMGTNRVRTLHVSESERRLMIDALTMWSYTSPHDAEIITSVLAKLS